MFLETLQIRFEHQKCSFSIPRIQAGSPQADNPTFLHLHNATPFRYMLLSTAKVIVLVFGHDTEEKPNKVSSGSSAQFRRAVSVPGIAAQSERKITQRT
jgi:hypothetical protein